MDNIMRAIIADAGDQREIDQILQNLQPLLRV